MSAKHADLKPNIPKFCEYFSGWHMTRLKTFRNHYWNFKRSCWELFEFETWMMRWQSSEDSGSVYHAKANNLKTQESFQIISTQVIRFVLWQRLNWIILTHIFRAPLNELCWRWNGFWKSLSLGNTRGALENTLCFHHVIVIVQFQWKAGDEN